MRILVIKEQHGLYTVETSAGVRTSGATLESALQKQVMTEDIRPPDDADFYGIRAIFNSIRPSASGQIASGQAAG